MSDKPTSIYNERIHPTHSIAILKAAVEEQLNRAQVYDSEKKAERSMGRAVKAFNEMFGKDLTVEEGWLFMVLLKMSRASSGGLKKDDNYVDMAGYASLAGEEACGEEHSR